MTSSTQAQPTGAVDRFFKISERGSSVSQEVRGGLVTFFAMAYIIVLNPLIIGGFSADQAATDVEGGWLPNGQVAAVTALVGGLMTLAMGLIANVPFGLAAGLGINSFLAFGLVGELTWPEAMGLVLINGVIIVVLAATGLRRMIFDAVPPALKSAIAVGIGLFIAFIGLKETGLLVPDPNTFVSVGDLGARWRPVVTAGVGFAVAAVLAARGVGIAVLIGIGASLLTGLATGITTWHGAVAAPPSVAPTAFQIDLGFLLTTQGLGLALLFLYTDLFDTVGTLVGVGTQAGLIDDDGRLERGDRAFFADAVGTVTGALLGTSTVTSYIESTAGVTAGARTGLASIVTAALFLAALFFHPLVETVGGGVPVETILFTASGPATHTLFLHPITAPALILVGAMMAKGLGRIRWDVPQEGIPAFLIVAGIPLTFSIADGISLGVMAWSALAVATRDRETPVLLHVLAGVLALRWLSELLG